MKKILSSVIILILFSAAAASAKLGGGDITFSVKGAGTSVFSHDGHVGKIGIKCSECHYHLYATVEKHTKATMYEMEKGRSCGACHNGQKAFDVKANCERCHKK